MQQNKTTNILLFLAIAVFLFGSGYKIGEYKTQLLQNPGLSIINAATNKNDANPQNVDMSLYWETWNKLQEKYVDKKKLDPQKMLYNSIKGMVASVEDPYTFFLTPNENKETKDDLGGRFEGIGAQLGQKDNQVVIVSPLKNSPAEKAGIKPGDIIVKVDDKDIKGLTLVQVVSKIKGPKGTKVKLTIQRQTQTLELTITREQINIPSIEVSYDSDVAVLKLNQFGEQTNTEWDKAVDDISAKWQKHEIKGMVLDLRDNPGGFLESAVYIASEFIPQGKLIVKQESTKANETHEYTAYRTGRLLDIPLTVLINQGSASASEIVSGALRDYNRAKLVGLKSFGKGSVQEAIDLKDNAGLHVTIAKWILPKGDWINGKGIEPDIKIDVQQPDPNSSAKPADVQLEKAIETVVK